VRLQLRQLRIRVLAALLGALVQAPSAQLAAQAVQVDTRATFFHEPAKGSTMTVYTPSTDLSVAPWAWLAVSAGWEADIVTGASEKLKSGPLARSRADVVSGASVKDVRHLGRASVALKGENTQLDVSGSQSVENDYKSRSLSLAARTDLFQHDTQLELAYARNWDSVCDTVHSAASDPSLRQPLDDSQGCFKPDARNRTEQPIRTDSFQVTWSQAWTPVLMTQAVYTGQLQHGFLSDPYRAVLLSTGGQIAQEHHPDNRARQALAFRGAYYLRPLKGALRLGVRAYRDTWSVWSATAEAEAEKYLASWLRLRVNARFYDQTSALFWSDDYTGGEPEHGPRGQYFSGDRELSPFSSWLFGARLLGAWNAEDKRMLGVFQGIQAGASLHVLMYGYRDFTLAGRTPSDTKALIGSLSFTALF
jgi:hypothetical protein